MVISLVVLFGWIALPLFMLAIVRRGLTGPMTPTINLDPPRKLLSRKARPSTVRSSQVDAAGNCPHA